MGKTSIEWTDFSINPIRARWKGYPKTRPGHYCEKISPGCKNCYASRLQPRFGMPTFDEAAKYRKGIEVYLDESKLQQVLRRKKPTKYFWCDMTDMFGDWVLDEWIEWCFQVMRDTPQHVHQVLTKRPRRMSHFIGEMNRLQAGLVMPISNVWLGISAENDEWLQKRWRYLRGTPAAVRFISYEPALGPLWLRRAILWDKQLWFVRPDWVIAGAESGPNSRPYELDWFRWVRDDCRTMKTAFFLKQFATPSGKKIPLPELDGRTWDQFPEVSSA